MTVLYRSWKPRDTQLEDVVIPVLLRHARNTYGSAMRQALAEAGYDDIPGNGLYVIGGLALNRADIPLGQLILELRLSKQAAGQLVDTLVTRGYLDRASGQGRPSQADGGSDRAWPGGRGSPSVRPARRSMPNCWRASGKTM